MRAFCAAAALALVLPLPAAACHQLSAAVWMCAGGTDWAVAEWDPYGDGATLLLEDYILNFTQDWPGAEIRDDLTTLEEQFVTYAELAEADGDAPLEIHRRETLDIAAGRAFRSLQRDRVDDVDRVSAVMLAEVDAQRIMLWLDAPGNTGWDEIDLASYEVLTMLRAACVDPATCAAPDQARIATE